MEGSVATTALAEGVGCAVGTSGVSPVAEADPSAAAAETAGGNVVTGLPKPAACSAAAVDE